MNHSGPKVVEGNHRIACRTFYERTTLSWILFCKKLTTAFAFVKLAGEKSRLKQAWRLAIMKQ
jgi:hypothetical protein